ncbi:hypothetical protein [Phyllobacterium sophorae]|uniref:DUF4365 domain-containing protein n=1 Tax=Phyllobacterium sophorae TaxID=1520277 RepID=A0A2P7B6Z6_9HYPH|nr:hypothetical protein [Phyllobacterium sophorae]PSH62232.1 hypothetical protein CU103_20655 [Phyllobacterium sophorae]
MKSDPGTRGQNELVGWCEPEHFIAHKPDPDRLGWDFLLEATPDHSPDRPLDQQNSLPKFLLQVKSTEQQSRVPRIKLSALKHLVDADLPAAIAVLYYTKASRRSVRRLIVPIDDGVIADTLRAVREQEAAGNRAIHNVKVPVPVARGVEIGPDGEGLSTHLHQMLGGDPSRYVSRKINFRESCGFDDEPTVGRFFIPGENARQKLGELFLGSHREIEVSDLIIERRRFGVPLKNDQLYIRDAILAMNAPPISSASIEIESSSGEWIAFSVDVFIPPPFAEGATIRFANQFFELNMDFEKRWAGMVFNYEGERDVDLAEAVSIVELGAILARESKSVTIHFGEAQLPLEMSSDQGPFSHWIPVAPVLRRISDAIERSQRRAGGPIKLSSFYEWVEDNAELLALGSTPGVNMFFPRWADDAIVDSQEVILAPMSVDIAGILYSALVEVPIVSMSRADNEIRLIGGQPTIVDDVVRAHGSDISDFIDFAVEKSRRRRNSNGPAFVAGGFENWTSSAKRN